MLARKCFCLLSLSLVASVTRAESPASLATAAAQVFAPGEISGPANDGAPTFSPDGNTLFYTRSAANWTVIVESHKVNGHWSHPVVAPFSGEWPDSSPAMSPDGSYLVFQSTRPPTTPTPATDPKQVHRISNLWRVDRVGPGWSKPARLPDTVNIGHSIWKPSIAADGAIYLTSIDEKGHKRLYVSLYKNNAYQQAEPLPFSDGATSDVDPEIAPDGSFLVFVSAGRMPDNPKDHLFIVLRQANAWGPVVPISLDGDDKNGYSTDDEPRLGPDHHTLYFSSDRVVPVHFPRTPEQAQRDLDRMDMWDNSNSNVWFIPLSPWLNTSAAMKSKAAI